MTPVSGNKTLPPAGALGSYGIGEAKKPTKALLLELAHGVRDVLQDRSERISPATKQRAEELIKLTGLGQHLDIIG